MKNYAPLLTTLIVLMAGCIKDPEEPPSPPRPQWLINQVIQITATSGSNPFPGDPPHSFSKVLWEIEYNQQYKPWLRRGYSGNGNDTAHLQLSSVDTLYYDAQRRVKEIRTLGMYSGTVSARRLSYTGNDTLPFRVVYVSNVEQDTTGGYITDYVYKADTVLEITADMKGVKDTTRFVYRGGNLTHYYIPGSLPSGFYIDLFETYDQGPPIERFLNLSQGNVLNLPFNNNLTPRLSRGNWTSSSFYSLYNRFITYNELGHPVASDARQVVPYVVQYKTRYVYFATTP